MLNSEMSGRKEKPHPKSEDKDTTPTHYISVTLNGQKGYPAISGAGRGSSERQNGWGVRGWMRRMSGGV
jgi:hypothetical protein